MASLISRAESTSGGYEAAMKQFNMFQKERNEPTMDSLEEVHVVGENLELLIITFATHFSQVKVKKNIGTGFLLDGTKENYLSKVKESLKAKFGSHHFWRDPEAYTTIRTNFKRACNRQSQHDDDISAKKCHPLYRDLRTAGNLIPWVDIDANASDLTSINLQLMKKGFHQKRLETTLVFHSVGRGGEHFLLRWDECDWDARFGVPNFNCPQLKQVVHQCMVFVSNKVGYLNFLTDIFHAFACYFALEKGLLHGCYHEAKRMYVFPPMHEQRRENVAHSLTVCLQANTPQSNGEPPKYTSRSLRYGASTELQAHRDISVDERVSRGGWASGHNNADVYVATSPVMSKPGAIALAGFMDYHAEFHPPCVNWFGPT